MTDLFPEVAPRIDGDMANDRYTTRATLDLCKRIVGVADFYLDAAACEESHHAQWWCRRPLAGDDLATIAHHSDGSASQSDGLAQPWAGDVWCNPPFDDLQSWVRKAWSEICSPVEPRLIAMLLPENRREQPWWQDLVEPFRDGRSLDVPPGFSSARPVRLKTHTLSGRQPFGHPGNPEAHGVGSPAWGVVLLEWRRA